MQTAFIGVGSNLGDRRIYLLSAKKMLSEAGGIHSLRSSLVYETDPVGGPPQGKFLNAVWEVQTDLSPQQLFQALQAIEIALGRERKIQNGPRTIDLDLLLYEDEIIQEADLIIPHPRMRERWFVLKPLWDLAAERIHPVFKKSICELLSEYHAPDSRS